LLFSFGVSASFVLQRLSESPRDLSVEIRGAGNQVFLPGSKYSGQPGDQQELIAKMIFMMDV